MKRPMLAVLVAGAGLWLWLFASVMFFDRNFSCRDAAHFYYPLYQLVQNEWGAGRIPLWNPYDNCGMPLLANPTAAVFYPVKLLFALPISYRLSYAAYILWHVLQAALATAWVARSWGASPLAAALAGISFAFCGNVLFQYCNVVFLVGAAWLPLAWWCGERMLRRRCWQSALGLGACLALMVMGGDPQMAYIAGVSLAGYALALWRQSCFENSKTSKKARAANSKKGRPEASRLASLVQHRLSLLTIAAVCSGLLSAIQVLPTEEFNRRSTRATVPVPRNLYELVGYAFSHQQPPGMQPPQPATSNWYVGLLGNLPTTDQHHFSIYAFSVGPWRMIEYLFPNFSGRQFPTHARWLEILPTEGALWVPSLYMGLIPCVLALLAMRWRRFRAEAASSSIVGARPELKPNSTKEPTPVYRNPALICWLSWLALLFVIMSWGGYAPGWIVHCLTKGQIAPLGQQDLPVGDEFGGLYWLCTVLLPSFVQFRFPGKMLLPAALALSWLSATQFDRIIGNTAARQRFKLWMRRLTYISLASTICVLLLAFIWPMLTKNVPADRYWGKFDVWSGYADLLGAFLQTTLLAGCCGWMRYPTTASNETSNSANPIVTSAIPPWPALALVLLTILDLGWANGWMVSTASARYWDEEPRCAALIAAADRHWESHNSSAAPDLNSATSPPEQSKNGTTETTAETSSNETTTSSEKESGQQPIAAPATVPSQPYRVFRIPSWYPPVWQTLDKPEHMDETVQWDHDTLFSKLYSNLHIEMIEGANTLDLSELSQFFVPAFLPLENQTMHYVQPRRGVDMWNAKYFILPIHDNFVSSDESTLGLTNSWIEPRWTQRAPQGQPAGPALPGAVPDPTEFLADVPDVRILYNPFHLPRAWIVHDMLAMPPIESYLDPMAHRVMQTLLFPTTAYLDPRKTVVIENADLAARRIVPQANPPMNVPGEYVHVTRHEPLEVVLEGEMKMPGAVVLSDVFYPGWDLEGALDGAPPKSMTVLRANRAMRGALLPPGKFKLTFRYRPYWFYVGSIISASAWLALATGTLFKWKRSRTARESRVENAAQTSEV